MTQRTDTIAICLIAALIAYPIFGAQVFSLESAKGLQPRGVSLEPVSFKGRRAVRVMSSPDADAAYDHKSGTGGGIVTVADTSFHNGTIDVDVAGKPRSGAPALARGFVGVGFRLNTDASKYECIYIRPTFPHFNMTFMACHSGCCAIGKTLRMPRRRR